MKSSTYKGISFHKVRGRWRSEISISSRNVHLGYFDSAAEAARAYDRAVLKRDGPQAHLNFDIADYEPELQIIESYTMEELVAHLRGKVPHHSVKSENLSATERQKQLFQQQQRQQQQLLQKRQQERAMVANELNAIPMQQGLQRIGGESPIPVMPQVHDSFKRNASHESIQRLIAQSHGIVMGPAGSPPPMSARSSPDLSMVDSASLGGTVRSAFTRYVSPTTSLANSLGTSPSASPSPRPCSPTSATSIPSPAANAQALQLLQQNPQLYLIQTVLQAQQAQAHAQVQAQAQAQAQAQMLSTSPKCGQAFFPPLSGLGPETMPSIQYMYAQPANAGIVANQFAGH